MESFTQHHCPFASVEFGDEPFDKAFLYKEDEYEGLCNPASAGAMKAFSKELSGAWFGVVERVTQGSRVGRERAGNC